MNKTKNNDAASVDILVVEDSETQAEQIAELLSSGGYRVRIATNGVTALAQARAEKPTLIVSDIAMPEMDGFTLCRELKKDSALRDVPVILLTALSSLHDVIKGLDCGADNFIRKPFEGKYLLGRIRFILVNRDLRDSEKVQLGMRINLGGQTHFVTAERQQIFDLLISTYEEAIQMTEELRQQQRRIAHSYQSLEGLYKITEALNPAISEKAVAEMALDRALDLPAVAGGCIKLLDPAGQFRVAAVQGFGSAAEQMEACADCTCQSELIAGNLRAPRYIENCTLLGTHRRTEAGACSHVSIPIFIGERVLGVMNLVIDNRNALKEEDYQVLQTVGNQIAIALERARLYAHMETLVDERTAALQAERNRLSAVVNTTGALVLVTDPQGRIVEFNPACERNLGWTAEEVRGRYYWEMFFPPEYGKLIKTALEQISPDRSGFQVQQEWTARNGGRRTIIWSTSVLNGPDGTVAYLLGTGLDITELRHAEEKVQYLSHFDVLTGLPNRILFRDQTRLQKERAASARHNMGFLVIHFHRLPLIRETLGPQVEQEVLLQIAGRLKEWAKTEGGIARLGDSRFAAVALRPEPEDFSLVARQVLALMDEPFLFEEQELHVDAVIGITIFPNDGNDFEELYQGAEAAMRRALVGKMERYEFYRPELNHEAHERFKLESALRRALNRDEFVLHYQPQLDIGTGRIIGVEALLRWYQPERGMIPPAHFIGLAEETGLILPIGEWVLRKACEQCRAWQDEGLPGVPVAVNISAKQFSEDIVDTVRHVLDETGLDPRLLELELTESLSMEDPESSCNILRALKDMGVRLAIDDFGTGYSNLNYLKRFPVDKLKLDRSFVRDLTSDPDGLSIARAVIAMAHSLRLKVIAEGVETEGQLAILARHGCDEMQGYLFSKPVDAKACATLMQSGASLSMSTIARNPCERVVLLVDDNAAHCARAENVLQGRGYKVRIATSVAEAFEILATADVGAVLCEQDMPAMSGVEFLQRVRQLHPAVARVVLSAKSDSQPLADAVAQGTACRILAKPWEESAFLSAVDEAFREFEPATGAMH